MDDETPAIGPLGDLLREAADHADVAAAAADGGDPVAARRSLLHLQRLLDRVDERTATAEAELADATLDAWIAEAGESGDAESTSG